MNNSKLKQPPECERIAKKLSRAGVCSRRQAEKFIFEGRIKVNGLTITTPATKVSIDDIILFDNKKIPEPSITRIWRFHKPKGCLVTHKDPEGRTTIFDILPKSLPRVMSVGRLDYDSEGLILLTNNGETSRKLELPSTGWLRKYKVRVHGFVDNKKLDKLKNGVKLDSFRTGPVGEKNNSTAFIIERGNIGLSSGKKENKLGMRASETAEMIFSDCIIDDSNRLGEVGDGFKQSMKILDGGRISIAALSLGIAKGAFEASVKYSKEREQFGKPIGSFQGISFMLADMATEIEAASLMTHQAGEDKNQGKNVTQIGAMAKLFSSEVCVKVANNAVQIHGGYGFIKDFPVEKFYRDSKLCTIGEGTSEIQKLVIARNLLKS